MKGNKNSTNKQQKKGGVSTTPTVRKTKKNSQML